jgi:rubrerythrin
MKETDYKDKCWLLFDICSEIEGLFAELYYFYSDHFKDDQVLAALWKKTAEDEENHQKQFNLARRLVDEINCKALVEIDAAEEVKKKLQRLLQHLRNNPPDIVTALTKAIEMEEKLMTLHASTVVDFESADVRKLFIAMQCFDKEHILALRKQLSLITQQTA